MGECKVRELFGRVRIFCAAFTHTRTEPENRCGPSSLVGATSTRRRKNTQVFPQGTDWTVIWQHPNRLCYSFDANGVGVTGRSHTITNTSETRAHILGLASARAAGPTVRRPSQHVGSLRGLYPSYTNFRRTRHWTAQRWKQSGRGEYCRHYHVITRRSSCLITDVFKYLS